MRTLKERFDEKFRWTPSCWLWTGAINNKGYGQIRVSLHDLQLAHRVAYELYVGPIPAERLILHRCDVRACVNPFHLWPGTAHENTQDMLRKGRGVAPVGEENGSAKLTAAQVLEIRAGGGSIRETARLYGVTHGAIEGIRSGKTWRWLDPLGTDVVATDIHQEHQ